MKLSIRILQPIFFFVCMFLIAVLPAEAAEHEWKMATSWPGGPIYDLGAKALAEKIEMLTEGRIKVEVFTGGVLGKPLKVSEAVKAGVAQAGHTWAGYDWGKDKTGVLFGGFAGSFDNERMLHWLYEAGGVELWKEWREEKFGVVAIPAYTRTAEVFLHSHKPIKTLQDLKGLKLRTTGAWLEIAKDLGAAPITVAGGDVFPMLERKAIDATEWGTLYENKSPGFHRVAKYIILPGVHQPTCPLELVINKKAWGKLSERDKSLVQIAAKLVTLEGWMRVGHEDAKAYKFYKAEGNEFVELDVEVQKEAKRLGMEWAEKQAADNEWFKKVYDSQKAFTELWKDAHRYRNVRTE